MVVSGAAGAVGSIACQIGKRQGAKVIAIAGTDEKCRWLEKELGVDKALNYKSPTFHKEFVDAVDYLDVFFDNVGGDILNFALTRLKQHARIVLCGMLFRIRMRVVCSCCSLRCYFGLQYDFFAFIANIPLMYPFCRQCKTQGPHVIYEHHHSTRKTPRIDHVANSFCTFKPDC